MDRAADHARERWWRRRSRGCSTRACQRRRRCAARSPAAARCRRRCCGARDAAGVPVSLTYGLTEACSQVDDPSAADVAAAAERGPAAVLHPRGDRARRRDPRARADRRAAARSHPTAGCTPATSACSTRDGRLMVTGRRSDTIVSGGENVAPAEVEAVLAAHPDVREAGVFGRPTSAGARRSSASSCARRASRSTPRSCARTARARWRPTRSRRCRVSAGRCRAPHSGKLLRRRASAYELRRRSRTGAEPASWERPPPAGVRRSRRDARDRRAGLAVDDRRDRAAPGRARARARRRPRRDRDARGGAGGAEAAR